MIIFSPIFVIFRSKKYCIKQKNPLSGENVIKSEITLDWRPSSRPVSSAKGYFCSLLKSSIPNNLSFIIFSCDPSTFCQYLPEKPNNKLNSHKWDDPEFWKTSDCKRNIPKALSKFGRPCRSIVSQIPFLLR